MTVGEKIKSKRLELGWSQDELAKKCGYKSRSSINKIELARDLPLRKIEVMAKVLGVTPGYLMGWEDTNIESIYNEELAELLMQIKNNPNAMELDYYYMQLSGKQQEGILNMVKSLVTVEPFPDQEREVTFSKPQTLLQRVAAYQERLSTHPEQSHKDNQEHN